MGEDLANLPPSASNLSSIGLPSLKTFRRAILLTRNSSPGKDGIPFKAWRKTVDFAAKALYEVFLEIVGDNGMEKVRNEWNTFNESVMVFLPKNGWR